MKESKSIDRFKKQAQEFNKLIEGKSDEEIERLVSTIHSMISDYSYLLVITWLLMTSSKYAI